MSRFLVSALIVFGLFFCLPLCGRSGPRSEWMQGYVKMESADKALAAGRNSDALGRYREAQEVFERVRRKYPSWNSSLLNYRINYCKEQIEKLGKMVGKSSAGLGREELMTLTKEQHATISDLNDQRKKLQSRVEVLAESLKRARGEAARNAGIETSLNAMTRQNKDLKDRLELLELKLSASQREVSRLKGKAGMADELKRVESELRLIQDQLRTSQQALTEARLSADKHERESRQRGLRLEGIERERNDLTMALKVVRELAAARKQENGALQAKYVTLEKRLADNREELQQKVKELEKSAERIAQLSGDVDNLRNMRTQDAQNAHRSQMSELRALRGTLEELSAEGGGNVAGAAARRQVLEKLANHLSAKDAELSKLAKRMASLFADRERLLALEEELAEARRSLIEARGESDRQRAQALTNNETAMTLRGELERTKGHLAAAERQCLELRNALDEQGRIRRERLIEAGQDSDDPAVLKEHLASLELTRRSLDGQLKDRLELVRNLEAEIKTLRKTVKDMTLSEVRLKRKYEDICRAGASQDKGVQAMVVALHNELDVMAKRERKAQQKIQELERSLSESHSKMASLSGNLREQQVSLDSLRKTYKALQKREATWESREQQLLDENLDSKRSAADRLAGLENQLQSQQGGSQAREQKLTDLHKKFDASESSREDTEKMNQVLRALVRKLEEKLLDTERRLADSDKKLSGSQNECQALSKKLSASQIKLAELERRALSMQDKVQVVDGVTSVLDKTKRTLSHRELENKDLRQRVTLYEGQLRESEVKVRSLEKQLDSLMAGDGNAVSKIVTELRRKLLQAENRVRALEGVLADGGMGGDLGKKQGQAVRENEALRNLNETLKRQNAVLLEQAGQQAKRLSEATATLAAWEEKQGVQHDKDMKPSELSAALAKARAERTKAEARAVAAEVKAQSLASILASSQAEVEVLQNSSKQGTVVLGDAEVRAEQARRERERSALVEGYVHQGLDAERQGKVEAARWNYEKALSMESDNKTALQRLGQLAYAAGDDTAAIRYLRQAFYHDPDDSKTLFALGYSYARQSKADWAVSMMGRAVALNPDDATMARVYGATLVQLGWTDAAEREFRRSLKLNPKEKDAAFNLSVLLLSKSSKKTHGLTASKYAKLKRSALTLGKEMGDNGKKVVQVCLSWLDALVKPGLSLQAEAKRWYDEAKKLGVEPDPALEAVLK